jgi:hypothetical protein
MAASTSRSGRLPGPERLDLGLLRLVVVTLEGGVARAGRTIECRGDKRGDGDDGR